MAAHTGHAGNTARDRAINVVLVPEHLRERVEQHVRQLIEDENDVSGFMLSGLMNGVSYQGEMKKCEDKILSWRNGNTFLKCIG